MEEINLKDLFNYYIEQITNIILITILVVVLGIGYGVVIQKPRYESSTSLILTGFSSNSSDGTIINTNDLNINQKLLATYQEITTSRKVLNKVINELNLSYNEEKLKDDITVVSVADTEIIKITVSNEDAVVAYKIANEIADVFSKEVKEIYNVSNVSVLDEAEIPEETSNISMAKLVIISFALGLILSCSIYFVVFYFDTRIKSVEQLERKIDVPILGSVPVLNSKRGKK